MKKVGAFVRGNSIFTTWPAICAAAVGMLASAQPTAAQGSSPIAITSPQFSSGMVGLVLGQTARLNVVNVGASTSSPLPCVLLLAFLDSDSKILKQMFVSVAAGKAASLDLTMNAGGSGRLQIRGIGYNPLLTPGSAIPQPLSCNLVPTLELFDTETGKTAAIMSDFRTIGSSGSPWLVSGQP
jgi:hypothetical protein